MRVLTSQRDVVLALAIFIGTLPMPEDQAFGFVRGELQGDDFGLVVVAMRQQRFAELQPRVAAELGVCSKFDFWKI